MAEGRLPLPLALYRRLASSAGPVYRLLHRVRRSAGKDDPLRGAERFGVTNCSRPTGPIASGPCVWVHAASVGETVSVLPLIERLVAEGAFVVLTTVTRTSAELAADRLPKGAVHQFACYDHPAYLGAFLDHWRPDLALVVESEVWPVTWLTLAERHVPLVLINGRMSEKSFRGWSRVGRSAEVIFGCLDLCLAQSPADAERLALLGARHVGCPGNLKFDGALAPADPQELERLQAQIGARPVWLAALTHPGEEEIVLKAHHALLADHPDLLLLLVPRHPARAADVRALCEREGLSVAQRSAGDAISPQTGVYLGDTIGEMGIFYSLCSTIFLGGSFADVGGHNPLEPLRAGAGLITGPKVANARTTYQALWQADAACRVETPEALTAAVAGLLFDPARAERLSRNGQAVIDASSGAVERTLERLRPLLASARAGRGERP
ncbi:3-deoxy-D-manno-octulosonic acid transferase [Roseibium aestuarii]|uniref:3-deoxy-D-manno-octulosonic acid transferase n=1 Tax=Roseibium aestuarii TaxID=2600299 RepID=A0ABW4JUF0_9HYPH|nr:3-deoxy-D-manno-octulosonic acid transferase [Roseibium aestuarii]